MEQSHRRLLAAAVVVASTGCAALVGLGNDFQSNAAPDASADTSTDANPPLPECDGGCCVVYVSASTGSENNSGCTQQAPKQTISQALAVLEDDVTNIAGKEVWVCAGTYTERDLTLSYPVALRGAFDCGSWNRLPSYGYPTFSAEQATVVQQAPGSSNPATLTIAPVSFLSEAGGPDAGADGGQELTPTVDGLNVLGPLNAVTFSYGINVLGGSRPILSNNVIVGGTAAELAAGIKVANSAPEITLDRITFGTGAGLGASYGVFVFTTTAAPHIHQSLLQGGNGTGSTGAYPHGGIGLLVTTPANTSGLVAFTLDSGTAIENNVINGGSGTGAPGSESDIGLFLNDSVTADVVNNVITGGTGPTTAAGTAATEGVVIESSGPVTLVGNRIFGGVATTPNGVTRGVVADHTPSVTIINNMIHGGVIGTLGPQSGTTGAITCSFVGHVVVEDNTLFAGAAEQTMQDAGDSRSLFLTSNEAGAFVRGNILAGSGLPIRADWGIVVDRCGELAALQNNLFVNQSTGQLQASNCVADASANTKLVTSTQALFDAAVATGNVILTSSCAALDLEAGVCAAGPCPSATCLPSLLVGWMSSINDQAVTSSGGWALQDGSPCQVTQGGINLSQAVPPVTTDIGGTPRPVVPSIGAWQFTGMCR